MDIVFPPDEREEDEDIQSDLEYDKGMEVWNV
jgi:hypothetical protein